MATPASPCRLFVFLARKARTGVILRRGPSAWTQLILWDRATDRFTPAGGDTELGPAMVIPR